MVQYNIRKGLSYMADIYDSAFRTVLNDCSKLMIPIINISFGERYTGNEKIIFYPNEHFIDQQNAPDEKRITDTNFAVYGTVRKIYHWECQSTPDSRMLIRLFEYDAQIALDQGEIVKEVLTVEFPHTAVLYLRYAKTKTPDAYKYVIKTPGGRVEYDVPLFKTQQYTLDEIFEKKLFLLIPFYIFSKEAEFSMYEAEPLKLEALKNEYMEIIERLDQMVQEGWLSDFDRSTLLETAKEVMDEIAKKYQVVVKGMDQIMGGALLETNARKIKNEGRVEGFDEKGIKIFLNLLATGMSENEAQCLAEIDDELVKIALKSRDM